MRRDAGLLSPAHRLNTSHASHAHLERTALACGPRTPDPHLAQAVARAARSLGSLGCAAGLGVRVGKEALKVELAASGAEAQPR